ncbi:MAG TPA: YceI family protein [Acidimicrobiales bacterium]
MASPNQPHFLTRRVLPLVALVVVVGGAAFWYFFIRDTAPKKLSLSSDSSQSPAKAPVTTTVGGSWLVVPGSGSGTSLAGYRVQEKFAASTVKTTAAGRSTGVTGSVTATATQVAAASIKVDMTKLTSDKAQRDNQIKGRGLQTDQFPTASFVLAKPIALPTITAGKVFSVPATGKLTLHGVTKHISITLHAKRTGNTFLVQGSAPVKMADYKIDPPNFAGFVSVDDHGSFEFLISLRKA